MRVTWPQVLAWRVGRQYLRGDADPGAVGVVRRLGGVQAQVASAAEQAVAVRRPRHEGCVGVRGPSVGRAGGRAGGREPGQDLGAARHVAIFEDESPLDEGALVAEAGHLHPGLPVILTDR